MTRPSLELIFVGFGNVARRLVTLLDEIDHRLPFACRAVAVLTSRHGGAFAPEGIDTLAAARTVEAGGRLDAWPDSLPPLVEDGSSNAAALDRVIANCTAAAAAGRLVCVETTLLDIRAGEPGTSHVRTALEGRAHVITANKGPAAFAYHELADHARAGGRRFLFEGAVMDGIPVFNLARETLPSARVTGFRGVINSTTNHILTMLERGDTFDAALAQMQREGIAEADPSLDVDGWDAAAKTAALMNVLMDARLTPRDVQRQGIRDVRMEEAREARAEGFRLRLVASAERDPHPVGRVRVERVPQSDPLAQLEGMQNALLLHTDVLGEVGILQRDGGLTQTAYALVSDLHAIAREARA